MPPEPQPQYSPAKGIGATSTGGQWTFAPSGWQPVASSRTLSNFQAGAGNPNAILNQTRTLAGGVGASVPPAPQYQTPPQQQADPNTLFGQELMKMMQKYQQLGTRGFATQELNARDAQSSASTGALLDPSLRGYSPSTIMGAGEAASAPYDPTIRGAQESQQTFGEQIRSFGDSMKYAQQLLRDQEDQLNKARDDARAVIKDIVTSGGLQSLKKSPELAKLQKLAGYPEGLLEHMDKTYKDLQLEARRGSGTPDEIAGLPKGFKARLQAVIDDLYQGKYGTDGAREQAIKILQNDFPNTDINVIARYIYVGVPDNWANVLKGNIKNPFRK